MISTVPGEGAHAEGGLKIGSDAHNLAGAWERSATNKHAPGIYRRIACKVGKDPTMGVECQSVLRYTLQ